MTSKFQGNTGLGSLILALRVNPSEVHKMSNSYLTRKVRGLKKRIERRAMGTVTHVDTPLNIAALTFDDGPHPLWTPKVLDILGEYSAKGTFFVLGKSAEQHPDIIAEMKRSGHALGNHSWDHQAFTAIPHHDRERQLKKTERLINTAGPKLFRPPYGYQNSSSRFTVWMNNYRVITWSVCPVPEDWRNPDPHILADQLIGSVQRGSIVLLHDSINENLDASREGLLIALTLFLEKMRNIFSFVTVPELLHSGKPVTKIWVREPGKKT